MPGHRVHNMTYLGWTASGLKSFYLHLLLLLPLLLVTLKTSLHEKGPHSFFSRFISITFDEDPSSHRKKVDLSASEDLVFQPLLLAACVVRADRFDDWHALDIHT